MQLDTACDERGDFLIATCDDGRTFYIDPEDASFLAQGRYFVFTARSERCQYAARRGGGKTILLHREIMACPKGLEVDHEDGNGLNDRRYNLRVCTHAQNRFNSHHPVRSATGFRGVYETPSGRYMVMISLSNKKTPLGTFDTPEEAARVFDAAAFAHRGEFTQLNFPAEYAAARFIKG